MKSIGSSATYLPQRPTQDKNGLHSGLSGRVVKSRGVLEQELLPGAAVELTRFGGHLNTWGTKPQMEDVHHAESLHQAVSAGVPS